MLAMGASFSALAPRVNSEARLVQHGGGTHRRSEAFKSNVADVRREPAKRRLPPRTLAATNKVVL